MVSGRNGTNLDFPEQPSIASLFPAYESDTDASSEYNQMPPNFSHHDSPFPAYKSDTDASSEYNQIPPNFSHHDSPFPAHESDTDASSEYNQIPPNFSHHNSYSIVSIFPPACSQTDEIIIPNPTITSTSFSHVIPSSIGPTTIQISIPLLFPPTVSETEIDGSASSESNEAHPRVSDSKVSIFQRVRSLSNCSEIYETTSDHSIAPIFPAETTFSSYVFQQFLRSLSFRNCMKFDSQLKIVMKVQMNCQKCQAKALAVAAKANGVDFVELEGEVKDKVVVIGDGVDAASLATSLRKKVGQTFLLSVALVNPGY